MMGPPRTYKQALERAWGVLPTTSDGVTALSPDRRARLVAGRDPLTVLEAASTILADIENDRFDVLVSRFEPSDRRVFEVWMRRARAERARIARTPVAPLAVLAATTLALGQSADGPRSDDERARLCRDLTTVALRYNEEVLGGSGQGDDAVLAYTTRSVLWRAIEQEAWIFWTARVVQAVTHHDAAAPTLEMFRTATGLTVEEWWFRGFGEYATRVRHGARSWGPAEVDARIDEGWSRLSVISVADAVDSARGALARQRRSAPPVVTDPFDLRWLGTRPVVETPDGRRLQLWVGANKRLLLPAAAAQTVADTTGQRYDNVTDLLGLVGETLLLAEFDSLPPIAGEQRYRESDMPEHDSKCDYLIEDRDLLVGLDFTIMSPRRDLSQGTTEGVDYLVARVSKKFRQIYESFRWKDPRHAKRWLPVVVFVTPTAVHPLLNTRVHERLIADGVLTTEPDEVMTIGAPECLDLLQLAKTTQRSFIDVVREWRDSASRGAFLDWWLADQDALGAWSKLQAGDLAEHAVRLLSKRESP